MTCFVEYSEDYIFQLSQKYIVHIPPPDTETTEAELTLCLHIVEILLFKEAGEEEILVRVAFKERNVQKPKHDISNH